MSLHTDGEITFMLVQHQQSDGCWVKTNLPYMLFDGLSYATSRGRLGDRYRSLIRPQSATSELWQRYGVSGFANPADAFRMLDALRERRPKTAFRLVKRTIRQTTEVVV